MTHKFTCPTCQKDCKTDGDKSKFAYALEETSICYECVDKVLNKLNININDIKDYTKSDVLSVMLFKLILNQ